MQARPIHRSPTAGKGHWIIEGTLIRIADIQRDFRANGAHVWPVYRSMGLTDAEIRAALEFHFPPVRPQRIEVALLDATVHCECGEQARAIIPGNSNGEVECICGRCWRLPVGLERSTDQPARRDSLAASRSGLATGSRGGGGDVGLTEPDGVSIAVTVVVRAQQAVDRWSKSNRQEPFASAMENAANELADGSQDSPAQRAAFLEVAEAIRFGRGNAFSNREPLVNLAKDVMRNPSE